MKQLKLIKIVCACILTSIMFTRACYAIEQPITVSYTPTIDEIAPTEVKIIVKANTSGYGAIYDEGTELEIGEVIYQLKYGETKAFRIRPTLGYDVYRVMYDGEDITSELKQGRARSIQKEYILVIAGKGHNCELDVTYKKIGTDTPILPEEPDEPNQPENPENPSKPSIPDKPNLPDDSGSVEIPTVPNDSAIQKPDSSKSPNTGVMNDMNKYGSMVSISMVAIIATLLKRKKKDENI